MRLADRLLNALDVHAGEGRLVALLLLFSFCNGLVRTFTRSAAYALFLAEFSAQMLPYVYIGVSLIASLASVAYLQVAQRVSLARLLLGTLGALVLVFGALRLGIGLNAGAWLAFSLPIFYEVLLVMTNLALWNTAGRLLHVRQGKRLFGLIGTGEPTAAVVGGFLTAPIVAAIGTPNLLLLAAGTVATTLLDETDAPAGTTIIQKEDTDTSMHIIVDGEVRVHDDTHTLNHLHARDVFGEMALLDPEPRVASVTALADTRLLRLDQEPFYELMEEHNQVARGIIRMLTRHLRARVRDLAEIRAQLAASLLLNTTKD